jgi:tetratricopeptide (TPR) repeat protein
VPIARGALADAQVAAPAGDAPGEAPAGNKPAPAHKSLPTLPLPLVGRDDVLERLEGLDRTAMLLVGEPGVGKTVVAQEWIRREEAHFRRTIAVGPDPSGAQLPGYPIRRAVSEILQVGEGPSRQDVEGALGAHPEDKTGLLELFGFGGAASGLPLDVRRREYAAAVLGLMRRTAASFLFEDVHLYDAPSRRLLAQFVAAPGEATVLATAQHPEALVADLVVLRLQPLDSLTFDKLLKLGLPPGMAEVTGGSPFALVQWLRARHEGAKESTIEARLALLPEPCRLLAEAAAVAGFDVSTPLVAQLVGVADPGPAVAELAARGWLRMGSARLGLELDSPTLRRRLHDGVGDERRRALHQGLAQLLNDRGDDPIVVAYHAQQAGSAAPVLLERAGDVAREGFDDDMSARWYRAALDVGRDALAVGKGDEGRQIRIALKLGLVQRYRGDVLMSEQVLREALELSCKRGDRWAEVQARRGLARLASTWQNYERAREQLVAAVRSALGGADSSMLAELYLDLAEVHSRLGDHRVAEAELWEGMMLVTGGDGPEADKGPDALWRMLVTLGQLSSRARQLDPARSYGLHALRHANRIGSGLARARVHAFLGVVHEELGRAREAAEHRRAAADEMREIGDRRSTAELLLQLAGPQSVPKGDARAWLEEADVLAGQVGWQEGVQRSRAALAELG